MLGDVRCWLLTGTERDNYCLNKTNIFHCFSCLFNNKTKPQVYEQNDGHIEFTSLYMMHFVHVDFKTFKTLIIRSIAPWDQKSDLNNKVKKYLLNARIFEEKTYFFATGGQLKIERQ